MRLGLVIAAVFVAVLAVGMAARWLKRGPRGDVLSGIAWNVDRLYAFWFQRLRVVGREHVPGRDPAGPLIIVSNHTAGIDPALIQAACPCFVRFVMASDMRLPAGEFWWRFVQIIFVDRRHGGGEGLREAIRHVKHGGVLGIFPEGRLARPPETILPFGPGVGLIVRRTGAAVLPVLIRDTPRTPSAWGSIGKRGRCVIEFGPRLTFDAKHQSAEEIARALEDHFAAWTGWPRGAAAAAEPIPGVTPEATDGGSPAARPAQGPGR